MPYHPYIKFNGIIKDLDKFFIVVCENLKYNPN